MLTQFNAEVKTLDQGMQVEATTRGFKLIMDEPEDLGGTNTGMNPVEAVLCALGGCQAIVVKAFAQAKKFQYESFRIELEGDLDPDGFLGKSDARKGFQEVRYKVFFKTNESQEKTEEFARFVEETCPVCDIIKNQVDVIKTEVIVEK